MIGNRMRISIVIFALSIALIGCSTSMQSLTAVIEGKITDTAGQAIAGAVVELGNEQTTTDANGVFSFAKVRYGTHILSVFEGESIVASKYVDVEASAVTSDVVVGVDPLLNLIDNLDFSQGVYENNNGTLVPNGFTSRQLLNGNEIMLTDEYKSVGEFSLKAIDASSENTIWIESEAFPVKPGQVYRAEVDALIESGTFYLYIDFRKDGVRVNHMTDSSGSTNSEWVQLTAEAEASSEVGSEAETVNIIIYGNVSNVGTGYFDNIRLTRVQ